MLDRSLDLTLPSPIKKLNGDILWTIFLQNADMFNPVEFDIEAQHEETNTCSALSTTLRSSLVCKSWRTLLLRSRTIWGRVVRLDQVGRCGEEGREEILRRTGTAPLCIMGEIPQSGNLPGEFFASFLQANWWRVQKLHIRICDFDFYRSISGTVIIDAPILEWFAVTYPLPIIPDESAIFPSKLFGNQAPFIRLLRLDHITFNLDSPQWLGRLRNFKLTFSNIRAADALDAIKQMPLLEVLDLEELEGEIDYQSIEPESIHLPHLVGLRLWLSFSGCIAFARSIKPSSHCTLSLISDFGSSTEEDHIVAMQIVDRYAESFFAHSPQLRVAAVDVSGAHFRLKAFRSPYSYSTQSSEYSWDFLPDFVVNLNFPDLWLAGQAIGFQFCDLFLKYDHLSTIKRVTLKISETIHPSVESLIDSLNGVEALSIHLGDFDTITSHYVKNGSPFFPRLRAIRLLRTPDDRQFKRTFLKFISHRQSMGNGQIDSLDIGQDPSGDWAFLENTVEGLKVTWWSSDNYWEYVCGSGNPEMLRFDDQCS